MTVRWGIAGTGRAGKDFARALARVDDGRLVAVASRTDDGAGRFAEQVGRCRPHGSPSSMLADDEVDIVYIASPPSEHAMQAVAAIEAGKHVLLEKPFTMDQMQAQRVVAAARACGGFLMEALWSRFLPAYGRLEQIVTTGLIGEVRSVQASFGFPAPHDAMGRLFDPALGGGALLDLGIYPVHLATWLLGPPQAVVAVATIGPTGVDLDTVAGLGWDGGAVATAQASLTTWLPMTGIVMGSDGWVELPFPHHCPESLTIHRHPHSQLRRESTVEHWPIGGDGLRFEIAHVHDCLAQGLQQSPRMPWDDSLSMMVTLDRVRSQIGLVHPT